MLSSSIDKGKALSTALAALEKAHGKGVVMRLDAENIQRVPVISTGSVKIDKALGIGGFPRGRFTEVYGPESSGKTTLALSAIAQAQKAGEICAFVDAEHALDPQWAATLGVKVGELLVSQPDNGEQAFDVIDKLVASGVVGMIVVDSVSALTPKSEIEGDISDQSVGVQARLMSRGLRILAGNVKRTNTSIIFINQIRMKIGVKFGSPETTSGGNALKFYSSVRCDVRRVGSVKQGEEHIGNEVKVKVVKNKLAPPFKVVTTKLLYDSGFCKYDELIDIGINEGFVDKSGSWYSYKGERMGQGNANAVTYLRNNPDKANELEKLVCEAIGLDRNTSTTAGDQVDDRGDIAA